MAGHGVQVEGVKSEESIRVYYTAAGTITEATFRRGYLVVRDAAEPAGKEGVCVKVCETATTDVIAGFVAGWNDDDTSVAQWIDIVPYGQHNMAVYEGVAADSIVAGGAIEIDADDSFLLTDAAGSNIVVGTAVTAAAAAGDKFLLWGNVYNTA